MSETDIVARLREIVEGMPHTDRIGNQRITRDVRVLLRAAADDLDLKRDALEMIAGTRQSIDNLMSNVDIARAALSPAEKGEA